jgi:soluble lytic murein transglycosylase-like protein
MIDSIDLLKIASLMSGGSYKSCNCNNNNQGFDMLMISLLKAISEKNQIESNKNINKEIISANNNENLDTINSTHNSNKLKISSGNEDINTKIENAISVSSKKYGVDENLIRSIIRVESNFNPNVVSSAGAKGLMQLMPENCKDLGVTNPFDIEQNIDGGTREIKGYLDKYNGNVKMALMAYNGGPTRMMRRGVKSPEDIYLMPKETQNYVPKVMKYYMA